MNPKHFTHGAAGQLIRVGKGDVMYWAFVPQPLPPELPVDWQLARTLSAADCTLSELAGVGRAMPNMNIVAEQKDVT